MTTEKKQIAIITASPALGSIIAMMLEGSEQLYVQQFDNTDALMAHMRIVPLDLIVMDYHLERFQDKWTRLSGSKTRPNRDLEPGFGSTKTQEALEQVTAAQLVLNLRRNLPHRQFETMVMTSSVSEEIKLACKFARIDEVVIKPMSPMFLKERMLSRLQIRHFVQDGISDESAPVVSVSIKENEVHSKQTSNWPSNVVPLFKSGRPPHPATNQPSHF